MALSGHMVTLTEPRHITQQRKGKMYRDRQPAHRSVCRAFGWVFKRANFKRLYTLGVCFYNILEMTELENRLAVSWVSPRVQDQVRGEEVWLWQQRATWRLFLAMGSPTSRRRCRLHDSPPGTNSTGQAHRNRCVWSWWHRIKDVDFTRVDFLVLTLC